MALNLKNPRIRSLYRIQSTNVLASPCGKVASVSHTTCAATVALVDGDKSHVRA